MHFLTFVGTFLVDSLGLAICTLLELTFLHHWEARSAYRGRGYVHYNAGPGNVNWEAGSIYSRTPSFYVARYNW